MSTGSGVLVEGGFVVTNAHVVWPFQEVRVVFPDGSEFIGAPVLNSDLMSDLAIIGPIQTDADPLNLMDGEHLKIGSDLFLIGYPAELEDFPQPTITRGILSRLREWESMGITYFQTDASIAGGQSGGVLVSKHGEVVGISGFAFSEAMFGLVVSAADVGPRVARLIEGDDISGLGERNLPSVGGKLNYGRNLPSVGCCSAQQRLDHYMALMERAYVINEPVGTTVDIRVEGALFSLIDVFGEPLIGTLEEPYGVRTGSVTTELEGPHFVLLTPDGVNRPFRIKSNRKMVPYDDPDDGRRIQVGETIPASMDYPMDFDYFRVSLRTGEEVEITVDSMNIDSAVGIYHRETRGDQLEFDDNSGRGTFGVNAKLTFRAPQGREYYVEVRGRGVGGYLLSIEKSESQVSLPTSVPTPTLVHTPTLVSTPTAIPTATPIPTPTPVPTPTTVPTPTLIPTPAPTATPLPTPTPTLTPTPTPRPTPLPGYWKTRSPIPTSRGALVAEELLEGIHVVGGSVDGDGSLQLNVHESYHFARNSWVARAPAPDLEMWGPVSAVVDGKLFLIGGWPDGDSSIRVYDPVSDTWEYRTSIPFKGFGWGHASAVVNKKIYVIGGDSGVGGLDLDDAKLLLYDPRTDSWAWGFEPIPINRAGLAAETILDKIYVVGTGPHLQIYDPLNDRWTQGASLPVPVRGPGVAVLNGELYVLGGMADDENWNCVNATVQIYDPGKNKWRMGKPMSAPRCFLAAVVHSEWVHVFGGFDGEWRAVNTYEQFRP